MIHQITAHSPTVARRKTPAEVPPKARSYWQSVRYRLWHDHLTLCFGAVVLLIMLSALGAPWLAPVDPYQTSVMARLKPFGYQGHLLGTDELGRDMLSRLLYGGRVSLTMGMVPVLLATCIGGSLGIVAGYAGKHLNMAIMRVMDVFFAFPSILLAVAISGTMGGGLRNGLLALTLVFIPPCAGSPRRRPPRSAIWTSWMRRGPAAPGSGASSGTISWATCSGRCLSMPAAWSVSVS